MNYYFKGASLDNIEAVVKEQAQLWIDEYVHGKAPNNEGGEEEVSKEDKG
jgi:hypothetical protein